MADKITRIAIVDSNRCKPKRCAQECKKVCHLLPASRFELTPVFVKSCPVVKMGMIQFLYKIIISELRSRKAMH